MQQVKVSVIIPTYKRHEDITRAVKSVLNQTLDSFEVIVVDDNGINTEDGRLTNEAMREFLNDSRVKYIRHDFNKNGSAARNSGIKTSKGRYISFLDDDDIYRPERLEKMFKKMENLESEWGACYTGYVKHMPNGTDQYSAEKNEGNVFLQALMRAFYIGTGSNLFFRREVIEDIGLFDETYKRNQDLEYLVRVLKKYKIAYVDEILMDAFYDVRTSHLTIEEQKTREELFRKNFSVYFEELSKKEKREVLIMWNLDWTRFLLSNKKLFSAVRFYFKSKIPFKILVKYIKYALIRKRDNTSFGFVVKL